MKIINSLKKYFKNNELKNNFSLSSSDNILLKEKLEMLDMKLREQDNLINSLIDFTKVKHYQVDTSENEDFSGENLDIAVSNNIVNFSGNLLSKTQLFGQYYITLPTNLRPKKNYVGYWSVVVVDNVSYKFHIQVDKENPGRLNIFSYDTFPANNPIVFDLTYLLDNSAY